MKFFWLDPKGIGLDLQRVRKHLRLTLRQVAEESGMALSHVWNLEKGAKEMTLDKFFVLCSALGLGADDLIADNIVIDQEAFSQLCAEKMTAHFPRQKPSSITLAAEYQGAWCVLVCRMLLSPGESKLPSGSYDFPTPLTGAAFTRVAFIIATDFSLKRRRAFLRRLCKNPPSVLVELGLLEQTLVGEFSSFVRAEVNRCLKAGIKYVPWHPQPTKIVDFFLRGDDSDEGGAGNSESVSTMLGEFELIELETCLDIEAFKKRIDEQKKENNPLTATSANSKSASIKSDLQQLLDAVRTLTMAKGMKATLADAIGVSQPRLSEWLAGKYEPNGDSTLKILKWVEAQRARPHSGKSATASTDKK